MYMPAEGTAVWQLGLQVGGQRPQTGEVYGHREQLQAVISIFRVATVCWLLKTLRAGAR